MFVSVKCTQSHVQCVHDDNNYMDLLPHKFVHTERIHEDLATCSVEKVNYYRLEIDNTLSHLISTLPDLYSYNFPRHT